MKKLFLPLLLLVTALIFTSCPFGERPLPKDSEIFKSVEPLEWREDYVVTATNEPPTIQVWDTRTNELVREIPLYKKNGYLHIRAITLLDHAIWMIAAGNYTNLIRLDLETGIFEFKKFSYEGHSSKPYDLMSIDKSEDGQGTVWVKSMGNSWNGTLFASYNSDGTLRESFPIECDISFAEMRVAYDNGKNYLIGCIFDEITMRDSEEEGFFLVDLSDKTFTPVKNGILFNENLLEAYADYSTVSKLRGNAILYNEKILSNTLVSYVPELEKYLCSRLFYKVNSYEPFEAEFLGIRLDDVNDIDFMKTDSYYYIMTTSQSYTGKEGLTITAFDINTLESKEVFIEKANQVYLQHKGDDVWISMDDYKFENGEYIREAIPEICKFDSKTGRVFVYSEDGTERELFWQNRE